MGWTTPGNPEFQGLPLTFVWVLQLGNNEPQDVFHKAPEISIDLNNMNTKDMKVNTILLLFWNITIKT